MKRIVVLSPIVFWIFYVVFIQESNKNLASIKVSSKDISLIIKDKEKFDIIEKNSKKAFLGYKDLDGAEVFKIKFPQGKYEKRVELDEDGSYVEVYNITAGDKVTKVYTEGILSSETWSMKNGNSLSKSWGDGRVLAYSWTNNGFSATNFYDHSMIKAKRIEVENGKEVCIKYNREGNETGRYKNNCKNDSFREYEDQPYE
jgi:hypothetical protein